MPVFRNRTVLRVVRNITAFVSLDAGLVRGEAPDPESRFERERERLDRRRRELESRDRRIGLLEGLDAGNLIWIFGTIRTGSTWLASIMREIKGHGLWNEPRIGEMFGHFFYERAAHRRENKNFILGLDSKLVWLRSIRAFFLESAFEKYPGFAGGGYLVVKEPSGSIGAPLLAEAFPESRLILLVRDPRDVVASALDAHREGGWVRDLKGSRRQRGAPARAPAGAPVAGRNHPEGPPEEQTEALIRESADTYLRDVSNSKRAYEAHDGPRALVRYEDLLADTQKTMRRLYADLDLPADEGELRRAVERHSWENIPEEEKGEGKFYRRGTAGGWREDLTPEQVQIVEETTAPLLEEFYPER